MFDDACMSNGCLFRIGRRRTGGGLFGLSDAPPRVVGESVSRAHVAARKRWPAGEVGVQVSWSHHGQVRILELADGRQLALWLDEATPSPEPEDLSNASAMSTSKDTLSA